MLQNFNPRLIFSYGRPFPVSHGICIVRNSISRAIRVDLAHPHTQKTIPALDTLSTDPILFKQVPALDTVLTKFVSFIDGSSPPVPSVDLIKQSLSVEVLPYLKGRFPPDANGKAKGPPATHQLLIKWAATTRTLGNVLAPAQLFPLVDMWRLALLDEPVGTWCASQTNPATDPVHVLLALAIKAGDSTPRNYLLTLLRMIANAFAERKAAALPPRTSKHTSVEPPVICRRMMAASGWSSRPG